MNKDLIIYEKNSKIILTILTNYNGSIENIFTTNENIETYLVDSNKEYILADINTGFLKFKNPDSKVVNIDDYR